MQDKETIPGKYSFPHKKGFLPLRQFQKDFNANASMTAGLK
jgi:hypothetical protein